MNTVLTWLMGAFFRWFPRRSEPGLIKVGNPDEDSPVLVTCNYALTVSRLLRAVRGLDLWVLSARSGGINVWCASCGGDFDDHQVISAVKTSRLPEKVRHRTLILPALSAPGMDVGNLLRETGFSAVFGPVRASDVPAFLSSGMKKTEDMERFHFGIAHRLDMLVSMNFIGWLPIAVLFAVVWPSLLLKFSAFFWGTAAFEYVFFPWIPGRTGWRKGLCTAALSVTGCLLWGQFTPGGFPAGWEWAAGSAGLALVLSFDLAGTAGPMKSDPETLLHHLGIFRLGPFLRKKASGAIRLDADTCTGCGACWNICPVGVFEADTGEKKTLAARPEKCFCCGACVRQCPVDALSFC